MEKKKNKFKILYIIGGVLFLAAFLSLFGAKIAKSISKALITPSKIRVTLPENLDNKEFDLYLGSQSADGTGNYEKLSKITNNSWVLNNNPFGEEEKDLKNLMVLKASKENLLAPESASFDIKLKPRINGEQFKNGMLIVDYWHKDWGDNEIAKTNEELKKSNVEWIFLAPAWDYTSEDPPKIENDEGGQIQYNEEQLKNHVKKLKADGFKVVIGPQVCCNKQPSFKDRSQAWWDKFFDEHEKYLLYHAKLAEEVGADVFIFDQQGESNPSSSLSPPNTEKKWEEMLEKIKKTYSGKVGLFDYVCCGAFDEGEGGVSNLFMKQPKVYEKFDLFVVGLWNPLSKKADPAQEELDKNTAKVFDEKIKYIYDRYKKPIMIEAAYRSASGTSIGTQKYSVDLISKNPDWNEFVTVEIELSGLFKSLGTIKNDKIPFMEYNAREQAMIYESIMKNVAEREWITGVFPFVYHMVGFDFPRQPDYDVRRKPVEKLIADWYKTFKQND